MQFFVSTVAMVEIAEGRATIMLGSDTLVANLPTVNILSFLFIRGIFS